MSTSAVPARTPVLPALRRAREVVRDTPAPPWAPGTRGRLAGYVAGSMVAWTVLGLAATAGLGALVGLAG
jgi:hypothetical protein